MLTRFTLAFGLCLIGVSAGFAQEGPSIPPVGIGTFLHPLNVDASEVPEMSQATTAEQRDRVHIFVLNGLDPLFLGNLNGMAGHLQALGFNHTRVYQIFQARRLNRDIRAVRQLHPGARIVVLGYSIGANIVRAMAHDLNRSGIFIDALVYMGGDSVGNTRYSRPDNVGKIINITGHGLIFYGYDLVMNGANIDGADNLRVDARHILVPSRRETLTFLSHEVVNLAKQPAAAAPVPVTEPTKSQPTADDGQFQVEEMMPMADD